MVTQPTQWKRVSGRRQRSKGYGLMNDTQEGARLALQHSLFKLAWRKNYVAPLQAPGHILDVACGTGIWGYEVLQEWPQAQVVNLDIDEVLFKKYLLELLREKKIRPEACGTIQADSSRFPIGSRFFFVKADARKPLVKCQG